MKPFFILALLLITVAPSSWATARINPFVSDGCSRWMDGNWWKPEKWYKCCFVHDLSYWIGGSSEARLAADLELKSCVRAQGELIQSQVIYLGVRVGGGPEHNTSYRWGYGWHEQRGYRTPTAADLAQVREELDLIQLPPQEMRWVKKFRREHQL